MCYSLAPQTVIITIIKVQHKTKLLWITKQKWVLTKPFLTGGLA